MRTFQSGTLFVPAMEFTVLCFYGFPLFLYFWRQRFNTSYSTFPRVAILLCTSDSRLQEGSETTLGNPHRFSTFGCGITGSRTSINLIAESMVSRSHFFS